MRLIALNQIDHHIAKKLRDFRIEKGIGLLEIGELVGLSFQQIQKYEKCENRISASKLFEIAIVLNKPISAFFEDFEPKKGKYYTMHATSEKLRTKEDARQIKDNLALIKSLNMIKNKEIKKHLTKMVKEIAGPIYRKQTKHKYS